MSDAQVWCESDRLWSLQEVQAALSWEGDTEVTEREHAMLTALEKAYGHLAKAIALVEKWPQTKDGAYVYPGMMLFPPQVSVQDADGGEWPFYPAPFEPNTEMAFNYGPVWCRGPRRWPVEECYSSEEAAKTTNDLDSLPATP